MIPSPPTAFTLYYHIIILYTYSLFMSIGRRGRFLDNNIINTSSLTSHFSLLCENEDTKWGILDY